MKEIKIYHYIPESGFKFDADGYPIDPFYEPEFSIKNRYITNYFKKHYNKSLEEVYNLLNGLDSNYVPKCKIESCNNSVRFRIKEGYGVYCSQSCKNEDLRTQVPSMMGKCHKQKFLNFGLSEDKAYLYIAQNLDYPDLIKFGVSTLSITEKLSKSKYDHLDIIVNSTREFVAELEYQLSKEFGSEWIPKSKLNLLKNKLHNLYLEL